MNIAHVISSLGTGGAEVLVAELSKGYKKNGHKVKVISILDDKGVPYKMLKEEGIEVIELKYKNKFNPKIAYDIYKYTKECDIVHTHTTYAQLYSTFFISKKKLITTEHSTNNGRRKYYILKVFDYLMYKKYRKIICINEATKDSLNSWLKSTKDKSIVIQNGIDIDKYKNAIPYERKEFGFTEENVLLVNVARFEPVKNHIKLIEAMSKVNKNVHLLLVGDGSLRKDIENKIKELQLEKNIHLLGVRDDVEKILKMSDIFILPSLWEGVPVSLLEARACGLPVIITENSSLMTKSRFVYKTNPDDVKDIENKINYLIEKNNNENYENNIIEEYSIEKMLLKYLSSYNLINSL